MNIGQDTVDIICQVTHNNGKLMKAVFLRLKPPKANIMGIPLAYTIRLNDAIAVFLTEVT